MVTGTPHCSSVREVKSCLPARRDRILATRPRRPTLGEKCPPAFGPGVSPRGRTAKATDCTRLQGSVAGDLPQCAKKRWPCGNHPSSVKFDAAQPDRSGKCRGWTRYAASTLGGVGRPAPRILAAFGPWFKRSKSAALFYRRMLLI